MKFISEKSLFLIIAINFLVQTHCSDEQNPLAGDKDGTNVTGKYYAVTYLTIGNYDSLVDVIELGGFINIELFQDSRVQGTRAIPETPDINGSGFEEDFKGTFIISNDSLQFKGMNNILSHPSIFFKIAGDSLNALYGSIIQPIVIIELKKCEMNPNSYKHLNGRIK